MKKSVKRAVSCKSVTLCLLSTKVRVTHSLIIHYLCCSETQPKCSMLDVEARKLLLYPENTSTAPRLKEELIAFEEELMDVCKK